MMKSRIHMAMVYQVPMENPSLPQTPFIICSLSKSFTAMAIMQLVQAGKIDLNAPIQNYIPWFTLADPEEAKQIKIHHLLSQNQRNITIDRPERFS